MYKAKEHNLFQTQRLLLAIAAILVIVSVGAAPFIMRKVQSNYRVSSAEQEDIPTRVVGSAATDLKMSPAMAVASGKPTVIFNDPTEICQMRCGCQPTEVEGKSAAVYGADVNLLWSKPYPCLAATTSGCPSWQRHLSA